MAFTLARKDGICKCCGESNTRCRYDGELVLCSNILEKTATPPGWSWRGLVTDKGGSMEWGTFTPSETCPICANLTDRYGCLVNLSDRAVFCGDRLDFGEVAGFRYKGRTKANDRGVWEITGWSAPERPQRPTVAPNYATPEQWHSFYASVDASLSADHAKDIKKRLKAAGLLDSSPSGIDSHLAQLKPFSTSSGYVIRTVSIDGYHLGAQIRANPDLADKIGKYVWWPSIGHAAQGEPHKDWPFDPTICNTRSLLFNGHEELPITLWMPTGETQQPQRLALVEGTGIKPYIAAQVLGCAVVGASSGNHGGSIEQIREIVSRLGITELAIVPDAGDAVNPHVFGRIQRQVELAQALGLNCVALWWGQVQKTHPDIDGNLSPARINQITAQEYLAMVKSYLEAQAEEQQSAPQQAEQPDPRTHKEFVEPAREKETRSGKKIMTWETPEEEAAVMRLKLESILACTDPVGRSQMIRDFKEQHRIQSADFNEMLVAATRIEDAQKAIDGDILVLREQGFDMVKYAIPGLVPVAEGTLIYGESGTGKSSLGAEIAYALLAGTGSTFLGAPVIGQYRVAFMGTDQSCGSLNKSLEDRGVIDLISSESYRAEQARTGYPWVSHRDIISILDIKVLTKFIEEKRPHFIILDSINSLVSDSGIDINSNLFAQALHNWVTTARSYGVGLIVLHHANKSKKAEGSSDLDKSSGNTKITSPFVSCLYFYRDSGGKNLILKQPKRRGGALHPSFTLKFNPQLLWDEKGVFEVTNMDKIRVYYDTQYKIIGCFKGLEPGVGLEPSEIMRILGCEYSDDAKSNFYNAVDTLREMGALGVRRSTVGPRKVLYIQDVPDHLIGALELPAPPPPPVVPTSLSDVQGTLLEVGQQFQFHGVSGPEWSQFLGNTYTIEAINPAQGTVKVAGMGEYWCPVAIVLVVAPAAPLAPPTAPAAPVVGTTVKWVIQGNPSADEIAAQEAMAKVPQGSIGEVVEIIVDHSSGRTLYGVRFAAAAAPVYFLAEELQVLSPVATA